MSDIEKYFNAVGNLDYKQFAGRHRPHIHPPGATLFVTYRLAGSIPQSTVREYRAQKEWLNNEVNRAIRIVKVDQGPELMKWLKRVERFRRIWFVRFEDILHRADCGPMWMKDERVAETIAEGLHLLDHKDYRLDSYSVMSNHVHTIFKPLISEQTMREAREDDGHLKIISEYPGLSRIMHLLKGRSARKCNLILSRSGNFWEHESFDHVIRPGKFERTMRYVLNNPVKAGLVKHWTEWPWNYCRQELSDKL
ncbi:MAG: hypothetical protein ABJB61_01855 [bacterium]